MADGKTEWPQDLKDFANRVFAASNDSNRRIVSEELRKVIFDAFQSGTINSTDWSKMTLPILGPGGGASAGGGASLKKGKKRLMSGAAPPSSSSSSALSSPSSSYHGMAFNGEDDDKKEKRARRFESEQRRFREEQESGWQQQSPAANSMPASSSAMMWGPPPSASTSLAGRLGTGGAGGAAAYPASSSSTPSMSSPPSKQQRKKLQQQQQAGRHIPPPSLSSSPMSSSSAQPMWTYDPTPGVGPNSGAGFIVDEAIADPNVIDWDRDTVVGLSTKLEKPYLRLTSAPDPKTVRPLPILQQTLELLKRKWRSESNYAYICDQFKSMRQDLTVQRIKNDFTVKVYEIHARIALEKGDLGEYNQCQSQLRTLYQYEGLKGSRMEFLAYRILYLLHTRNRREVSTLMAELTPASKRDPAVNHALQVRLSLATGNYRRFFKLFGDAPNMNAYIMDHFVERERVVALSIMARSYRPSLPLPYITSQLAFADDEETGAFLQSHGIAVYIDPTPGEAAALAAASSNGKQKRGGAAPPPLPPLSSRKWDCKSALGGIIAAGEKYRKIDIKGQI